MFKEMFQTIKRMNGSNMQSLQMLNNGLSQFAVQEYEKYENRMLRLKQEGIFAKAEVLSVQGNGIGCQGKQQVIINAKVTKADGTSFVNTVAHMVAQDNIPRIGDVLNVLIDPDNIHEQVII